jgi:hypothetical protein
MLPDVEPGGRMPGAPKANTGDPLRLSRVTTQPRSAVVTRRAEPADARDFAQFDECSLSDGVPVSPSYPDRLGPILHGCDRSCSVVCSSGPRIQQARKFARRRDGFIALQGVLLVLAFGACNAATAINVALSSQGPWRGERDHRSTGSIFKLS